MVAIIKRFLIGIILINISGFAQTNNFVNGVDVSFIPQIEALGGTYKINGTVTDPLSIFRQNNVNYIRLRIWHTPVNGYCGLESTLQFAQRIKQAGLKFLLDFHYSDTWADPGKQTKPAAWKNTTYNTGLLDSVYNYTYKVIKALDSLNALPDIVQIGNEISPGFLWPDGRVGGSYETPQQWTQFTNLLKKGISAVHDAASDTVRIMIHIDRGGNNSTSRWFFDHLRDYGVNYDIIGQSYYPWWHGTLTAVRQNLNDLALRYNKDIIIAETAYPWTLNSFDSQSNIVGSTSQLHSGYPASVEGQYSFLYDLIQLVKEVPNHKGIGILYWAPEYISIPSLNSPWENLTLFDFQGNALNSLRVFKETQVDTSNAINVTFTLNTSTNYDTLTTGGFVQLRGEVIDAADVLASGENLTWDVNSQVILQNINGDYWQTTVRVSPGTILNYKYWTGHTKSKATFLRLGWEGPLQPYDLSGGNVRKFIAGDKDTVLQVEYYNSTGNTLNQYWQPFNTKEDSVAVYFRVNMGNATASGRFDPSVNGPVGIRGENLNSLNILSWDNTNVFFTRETLSVANGSFWSGVTYYPKSAAGLQQQYKFFIEHDTDNGWENSISNRTFTIPLNDVTIQWSYFDNNGVTAIEDDAERVTSYNLFQNYPNPFNNSTVIAYELDERTEVNFSVYNMLGERINILMDETKDKGRYTISWNGKDKYGSDLSSGIYFIKMKTSSFSKLIKAVLMR